jgi:hypothetical protein
MTAIPIPEDRAVACAHRVKIHLHSQSDSYTLRELQNDAMALAEFVMAGGSTLGVPGTTPSGAIDAEFLIQQKFQPTSDTGKIWAAKAADGREYLYHLSVDGTGKPQVEYLDEDGGASLLPCPADRAELVNQLKMLKFVK